MGAEAPLGSNSVRAIAAASENGVIGRDGGLPWAIPRDKQHFLEATRGGTLVLGRRTFDETKVTYDEADHLSAQTVVVTSRHLSEMFENAGDGTSHHGVAVAPSVAAAVGVARRLWPQSPVWLCGGTRVYDEGVALRDDSGGKLVRDFYLTVVHAHITGDTFLDTDRLRAEFPVHEVLASDVASGGRRCTMQLLRRGRDT